jgi:hypothetical protein
MDAKRPLRVGHGIEDHCRVCKMGRDHTIVAVDPARGTARVRCDFCGSMHDYRGGARPASAVMPTVSEREIGRVLEAPGEEVEVDAESLERLLRRVIREESGLTPVAPADKWRGGELVLKPGREGLQAKSWPIETFFSKIVMLRNRLRVLEQHVNSAEMPDELKVKLQGYITACYGSLTSFNVLFADDDDRFKGSGA